MRLLNTTLLLLGLLALMPAAGAQDFELETDGDRLAEAIDSGSVSAVRRLLDSGVSANTLVYDSPPLQWAIWDEKYYVVKLLIDRGADVNLPDEDGYTSLMCACDMSSKRIVDLLLDKGADINAVELTYGMSALQSACSAGDEAIVDLLLERGADINHIDKHGANCLEEAAYYGHNGVVEKLKAKGLKSDYPLHIACGIGDLEEVKKQLAAGKKADEASQGWEYTPLHFAAAGGHLEIAKLLVENGAKIDVKNKLGATLVHEAASADHLELLKWLVAQGADINAKDEEGSTPLDWSSGESATYLEEIGAEYGEYDDFEPEGDVSI